MALKDTWIDRVDGVDDASAEDINEVAHAVIDLENAECEIQVDTEMSDTSENAVQNKVIKGYVDGVVADAKLKLLKTIILEEDVSVIDVEFDKPLDEVAILFDVAVTLECECRLAARTDGGLWYVFYSQPLALKTSKQFYSVHAKEIAERHWEVFDSNLQFTSLQGIEASTRPARLIRSYRGELISRFLNKLNILIRDSTSDSAFAIGSVIEIWGREVDE